MPATLAVRPATSVLREDVDILGDIDPQGSIAPRVAVSMTLHLSFPELLGLIAPQLTEDPADDAEVRWGLGFGLIEGRSEGYRALAVRAMADLAGLTDFPEDARFTALLATAVTRVFGITSATAADTAALGTAVHVGIDLLGIPAPEDCAPRVAVPWTVWLTHAELTGMLVFAPTNGGIGDDLADDAEIATLARYSVLESSWGQIEDYAALASAALNGRAPHPDGLYVEQVAAAVTRVFGIAR